VNGFEIGIGIKIVHIMLKLLLAKKREDSCGVVAYLSIINEKLLKMIRSRGINLLLLLFIQSI
jgi:hypothetical protein